MFLSMLTPEKDYKNKIAKSQRVSEKSKINSLIKDMVSKDGHLQRQAREALAFIGKPAVPPLIALLKDPDDDVRWEAAKALALISDPDAVPALIEALEDHNFGVRWIAADGLVISAGRPCPFCSRRSSNDPIRPSSGMAPITFYTGWLKED